MKFDIARRTRLEALVAVLALVAGACGRHESNDLDLSAGWVPGPDAPSSDSKLHTPPPPFSEGIFPCSECHEADMPVNTKRRELSMAHTDIVLKHDEEHRWCLDCHDAADRDSLHLAGGDKVPFEESYRLCGQCHGDKYRDWRAGVHGRRGGNWDGEKSYLLCVNCHNAHSPRFAPIKPLPPPPKPERTP
ncbi:MAG: hypothetical protein HZA52_05745 [Planctomycetes bacterium]|nr:hypothetical protein [Planctomycetota bacterium]